MAHLARLVVPRLPLYPPWRQPEGKARQLLNILIVWLATGLWHGAAWTFVLWASGLRCCCSLKSRYCCRCWKSTVCSAMCTRSFSSRSASCSSTQTALRRRSRASARCSVRAVCRFSARSRLPSQKLRPAACARHPLRHAPAEKAPHKAAGSQSRSAGAQRARTALCACCAGSGHGILSGRVVQPVSVFPFLRRRPYE